MLNTAFVFTDTKSVVDPASFGVTATFGNLVNSAKYRAVQNDHYGGEEGSGVNPGEGNPIENLVKAVRLSDISFQVKLGTQKYIYYSTKVGKAYAVLKIRNYKMIRRILEWIRSVGWVAQSVIQTI